MKRPNSTTAGRVSLRSNYLTEVSQLLWPDPAIRTLGVAQNGSAPMSEFIVVPNGHHPRLLLPHGSKRAAATAVLRYNKQLSLKSTVRARTLWSLMRTGIGRALMRSRFRVDVDEAAHVETIETYLRAALDRELLLSLHIGPARANRKPVLQLLSPEGETLGFAKVGINPLTQELVRREADSLRTLRSASLQATTVPEVLHCGRWRGHEVLVQHALPVWMCGDRNVDSAARLQAAMCEVAWVNGVTSQPLVASAYWRDLLTKVERACDAEEGRALHSVVDQVGKQAGRLPLRFGAWHGDWTVWNTAALPDTVLVWDWERFRTAVPLGFDALHYYLHDEVMRHRRNPTRAVVRCMHAAPRLLAPFGVNRPEADVTVKLYLVELAARYLHDGQAQAGARLGRLGQWLLPALVDQGNTTMTDDAC